MNNNIKMGSNRNFGIVFFILFTIISIYPWFKGGELRLWSSIIATIFFLLTITNSKLLTPLNKLWFKFGIFLGNFFSPIVMGFIFFIVVTPISLILKIFNKDVLCIINKNYKSYWIKKTETKSKMKNQF